MTARELEERQNYSTTFTLDDASTLLQRRYWLKLTMKHPERIDNEEKGNCMSDCLYKFFKEHPNAKDPVIQGMCPDEFSYLDPPENCNCLHGSSEFPELMSCSDCWHREIPEEEPDEIDRKMIEMIEKEENMSECCKETMCTTCVHQDVCSLKGKFLDAQKAVDGLVVYDYLPTGLLGQVKLRDIGFIKPVELECIHYVYKGSLCVK